MVDYTVVDTPEGTQVQVDLSQFPVRLAFELKGVGIINVTPHLTQIQKPRVLILEGKGTPFSINLDGAGFSSEHFRKFFSILNQDAPLNLDVNLTELGSVRVFLVGDAA